LIRKPLKKSFLKFDSFAICITEDKLIFAKWTQELYRIEAQKQKEKAKESGAGALKQIFSQMGTMFTYWNKYYEMDEESILKEHPENFALSRNDIKSYSLIMGSTTVIKGRLSTGGYESIHVPHQLVLDSIKGKMVLTFEGDFNKVKESLSKFFS